MMEYWRTKPLLTELREALTTKQDLTLAETASLLIEIRKYLEEQNLKDEYRCLHSYGNWLAHSTSVRGAAPNILLEINKIVRDPMFPYYKSPSKLSALPDALKLQTFSEQASEIISKMFGIRYVVDNHFVYNVLSCLVGIPLIPSIESKRESLNEEIRDKLIAWNKICPQAIITNMLVWNDCMRLVTNFMISNVRGSSIDFCCTFEDGETKYGFWKFKLE